MFNILFLKGFNNYFNRTLKKYNSITNYMSAAEAYFTGKNINFNPNDGVTTELIVGGGSQEDNSELYSWEEIGAPDYCVCYSLVGITPKIKSRWFILEAERTRAGQYRIALKRDLLADYYDEVMDAPTFIEKGFIEDEDDAAIYNSENMTFSQIKSEETPLKDSTGTGWIVGYIAKNAPNSSQSVSTINVLSGAPGSYYDDDELPFSVSTSSTTYAYFGDLKNAYFLGTDYGPVDSYGGMGGPSTTMGYRIVYYNFNDNKMYWSNNGAISSVNSYNMALSHSGGQHNTNQYVFSIPNTGFSFIADNSYYTTFFHGTDSDSANYVTARGDNSGYSFRNGSSSATLITKADALLTLINTNNNIYKRTNPNYASYNNKIVKVGSNYYRMSVIQQTNYKVLCPNNWMIAPSVNGTGVTEVNDFFTTNSTITSFIDTMVSVAENNNPLDYYTLYYNRQVSSPYGYAVFVPYYQYNISLTLISTETISATIPAHSNRATTFDNAFDLFALPYGVLAFKDADDSPTYYTNAQRSLSLARAICSALGENAVYDLQLLPYCPLDFIRENMEENDGVLQLYEMDSTTRTLVYSAIGGDSPAVCDFIIWSPQSKGSFNITSFLTMFRNPYVSTNYSDCLRKKINDTTCVWRLCSPNFSGTFEFSVPKNNEVAFFNVDYAYMPHQPYIHVNPDFKNLYGTDYNDCRGLICTGNFSLSVATNYWQTYKNNNKNYEQIFNRQIENLDVNNAIALEKQQFNAIAGGITGTLGAGIAGAMTGAAAGPWGAVAGAAVGLAGGAAANIVGAVKDRDWLERQQKESRLYAIDMYGYNLGNIQAVPYGMTGIESLTENNKIFPIIEIYLPTEQETEALINKIQFNGMTIMRIGKISDYCTTSDFDKAFVKGQLIRLDTIIDDFHIADAIYQEIYKGIYIPQ